MRNKFIQWLLVAAAISAAFWVAMPDAISPNFPAFALSFFALASFLTLGCFGIGILIRTVLLRSSWPLADIALGFGAFALLLSFYLRLTLTPWPLLGLLACGCVAAATYIVQRRADVKSILSHNTAPWIAAAISLGFVSLSFGSAGTGLLYFPNDFDSDLFHVAFPQAVVSAGHYLIPDWLRVPWHPQLTHFWYIFVLRFADTTYLKTINFLVIVQLTVVFLALGRNAAGAAAGAFALGALYCTPEFSTNVTSTSLDAVLSLFAVPAFALFCCFLAQPKRSDFSLLCLLCGFASGQKHFGLMFSAPILLIAGVRQLQSECFDKGLSACNWRRLIKSCIWLASMTAVYAAIFVPFYLHNILSGNSLLFPFFSGDQNTYGWLPEDLSLMRDVIIPFWGVRKDFLGFFMIPYHLLSQPAKFQFLRDTSFGYNWLTSFIVVAIIAAPLFALAFRRLRSATFVLPVVVLFSQLAAWYLGSQVIRYLFPVLIACLLFAVYLFAQSFHRKVPALSLIALTTLAVMQSAYAIRPASLPLAVTRKERIDWLSKFVSIEAKNFARLEPYVERGDKVLNVAAPSAAAQFGKLRLCGDYFAKCRWTKFIAGASDIHLREWPQIEAAIKDLRIRYIVVNWRAFDAQMTRPDPQRNWDGYIPKSTQDCLRHLWFDGQMTDVFKVKKECR